MGLWTVALIFCFVLFWSVSVFTLLFCFVLVRAMDCACMPQSECGIQGLNSCHWAVTRWAISKAFIFVPEIGSYTVLAGLGIILEDKAGPELGASSLLGLLCAGIAVRHHYTQLQFSISKVETWFMRLMEISEIRNEALRPMANLSDWLIAILSKIDDSGIYILA